MQQLSNQYDIILNADETPMYFDLPASKTIDLTGVQSVIVKTTGHEKLRYTVFLTSGVQIKEKATKTKPPVYHAFRLPPLIIFKNLVKPTKREISTWYGCSRDQGWLDYRADHAQ